MATETLRIIIDAESSDAIREMNALAVATDKVGDDIGAAGLQFTELASKIDVAQAAFETVSRTFEVAFDIGREGAAITQTAESFDRLAQSLGAPPSLLREMSAATRNTVSDMQIAQRTTLLLAGANDELGSQLLGTAPELLRIAKAASDLNPGLLSTEDAYARLIEGVKKGSTELLDELGIVTRIGEANQTYADSLGITVEAMNSTQRTQALLNEVIRGGAVLVEQAADANTEYVDSIARMDTALENAGNALKSIFAPVIADAADAVFYFLSGTDLVRDAIAGQGRNIASSADDWADYAEQIIRTTGQAEGWSEQTIQAAIDTAKLTGTLEILTADASNYADQLEITTRAQFEQNAVNADAAQRYEDMATASRNAFIGTELQDKALQNYAIAQANANAEVADGLTIFERWKQEQEETAAAADDLAASTASAGRAAADAGIQFKNFFDGIDRNVATELAGMIEDLDFALAGGVELSGVQEQIVNALNAGKITPEQAREALGELFVETQELQVDIDNLTADEAARNIADTLGVSLEDARTKMDGIVDATNVLSGLEATVAVNVELRGDQIALQALALALRFGGVTTAFGGGAGGQSLNDAINSGVSAAGGALVTPN